MFIIIIYDSHTGNTERMASTIAEGVAKVADIVQVKKVGDPFPLNIITESDGFLIGSPAIYDDITDNMKRFLDRLETYIEARDITVDDVPAGIFGSYGWDGGRSIERGLLKLESIGFKIYKEMCIMTDSEITTGKELEACAAFGETFSESI
jgi:flavorubredoxin